jgi:hypothetical protein
MSKACLTEEEANATIEHYKNKDGTEAYHKKVNSKWNVYRKSDNKTLKSVKYSVVDLKTILGKETTSQPSTTKPSTSTGTDSQSKPESGIGVGTIPIVSKSQL